MDELRVAACVAAGVGVLRPPTRSECLNVSLRQCSRPAVQVRSSSLPSDCGVRLRRWTAALTAALTSDCRSVAYGVVVQRTPKEHSAGSNGTRRLTEAEGERLA